MAQPHDNEDYAQNQFMVDIAKRLGLNPAQITNLEAFQENADDDDVIIRWEGVGSIPVLTFHEMLETHKDAISTEASAPK